MSITSVLLTALYLSGSVADISNVYYIRRMARTVANVIMNRVMTHYLGTTGNSISLAGQSKVQQLSNTQSNKRNNMEYI